MRRYLGLFLLLLGVAGCNLPMETSSPVALETSIATLVQATLTAVASETVAVPTPSLLNTPEPTASDAMVILVFDDAITCRMGPGDEYPALTVATNDSSLEVVGRYGEGFLQVRARDGTVCWLEMQASYNLPLTYLTVVPTVKAPPTPTPSFTATPTPEPLPPQRPIGLRYFYFCQGDGSVRVELTWQDRSDNEEGYRIYRDGVVLVTLPPDSSAYVDFLPADGTYRYEFEAYNGIGRARTGMTAEISCH